MKTEIKQSGNMPEILIEKVNVVIKPPKSPYKITRIKNEKISLENKPVSANIKNSGLIEIKNNIDRPFKRKKHKGVIRRFLSFEKLKFKNIYKRKFITLARLLKRMYNKKLNELQEKINFVNQCKDFFEKATESTLNHKKEFMSRLEQYEIDSLKLVEFFRNFERNKSEIENIANRISKVEFKTMLNWNRKFKNKFDKLIK